MKAQHLLEEILAMLRTVKDDKEALEKIHAFMLDEIYEEAEEERIPEKYKKALTEIADSLTAGLVCFLNPVTLEIEDVPKDAIYDPDEFEAMTGERLEDTLKHQTWEHCIEIEPLESNMSFRIMEGFVDEVEDTRFREKLVNALNRRKPFANFNHLIHNSDYREDWFKFRQEWIERYVWREIEFDIEKIEGGKGD